MRDHAKLRACELADEVRLDSVRAQRLTAFSLQPKHLSSDAITITEGLDPHKHRQPSLPRYNYLGV